MDWSDANIIHDSNLIKASFVAGSKCLHKFPIGKIPRDIDTQQCKEQNTLYAVVFCGEFFSVIWDVI